MKSIVEEASSIVKAIEKAWIRAGKPASFQVKVFEEPQKNFFGLTIRSAKIGLFFAEQVEKIEKTSKSPRKEKRQLPKTSKVDCEVPKEASERRQKKQKSRWTAEMVKLSREWLDLMFKTMGIRGVSYSIDSKGYYLNVLFKAPIFADKSKDQVFFKNISHLMMQMLRTKLKRGLVGYKIVLKQ